MASALSTVDAIVRSQLTPEGEQWLRDAVKALRRDADINQLLAAYTAASRRVGTAPVSLTQDHRDGFSSLSLKISFSQWTVADFARALMLLAAAEGAATPDTWVTAATACFDNGDAWEQQSWLRALALMPHSERFTPIAVDACRSHIQPVFESIACENPYPAAFFSERQFNQMVLKALFIGVRIERIAGLARRLNPALSRMARDYAAERLAAGRSIPADLVLALHDMSHEEQLS
jgi:hypothetical protein